MAYSITISTGVRRLSLYQDNRLVNSYPVGVGKKSTPTPHGKFTIVTRMPNPGGPFGVVWMGLSVGHYGIHGTNNPGSIGGYVSNGCIRMFNRDALALSRVVGVGTPVTITY